LPLSELPDVTLQIGDQKGGTESLMPCRGVLNDLPYKGRVLHLHLRPPQVGRPTAGKIDFAITGNTPPSSGAAANSEVKVVTAYENGGDGDRVLVHATRRSRTVADLRGKSVAVGKGARRTGTSWPKLKKPV